MAQKTSSPLTSVHIGKKQEVHVKRPSQAISSLPITIALIDTLNAQTGSNSRSQALTPCEPPRDWIIISVMAVSVSERYCLNIWPAILILVTRSASLTDSSRAVMACFHFSKSRSTQCDDQFRSLNVLRCRSVTPE